MACQDMCEGQRVEGQRRRQGDVVLHLQALLPVSTVMADIATARTYPLLPRGPVAAVDTVIKYAIFSSCQGVDPEQDDQIWQIGDMGE